MVFDIILPILVELIADPVKNYVVTPIKRHVSYAFKCDSNVQRLQQQVEQLRNKMDRLQQSVADATRNGEVIFPNVTKWLTAAEKDMGEAEQLIQRKDGANNKCFFRVCPNLKTCYQLSKISEKKALAIDERCNEQGLDSISFQPPLQPVVEPSLYSREALPSRVLLLNQVMDALKDPNLNTIGVYGMGGVGKTTLAKEVQAKVLQDKLLETAVVVPVSQTPELRRIQGEIADFLGLKFSAEEIPGRASQLFKRLENSKVLIILDDLWHKLDLNAVGIPSQGCKIMLTSRNGDLLSNEMQAQKLFSLEALKEEETLCLFQMSVAEAKNPQFHHIANEIAKKCGGLPLLVDMVAKDLRNKESYEWNHKLHQLSAAGDGEIYEKVHRVLESSYDNLPGEEMKQFFLLCALFGQSNIQIQYLLTHSMGLGLFKRIFTVEAARDSVFTMINKLKAKSLLLDGDMAGYVKMHDVVRDTALSIASKVQHAFIGAGEVRFRNWRNRDCTRISLPYCNISELPVGLDCPEAEAFLLYTEDLSLEIPDRFFDGMQKLKVADLRGMRLVSFPSSFALLANLQTLCLHNCRLDSLAVIGELRQLEYLSFANSNVVELPREIEALTSLKLLDLQGCRDLRVIHVNLFSRLCLLEELYMLDSFVRWNARGNVRLVELESLAQLSTLEIQIPDPKMIPEGFKCFSQLRRYKICIGWSWKWKWEPERSRMLKLQVEAGGGLEYDPELLLRETEDLVLDGVRGIERIFYEGFSKLKCMCVENVSDIQHLIKSTMPASCRAFPVLESLSMKNLQMLETICSGQLGMGSFGELRVLKISRCDKLSSLFSFSSIKCLQKLQNLEVEYCGNMEAVVGEGSEVNDEGIELIQLSSLWLSSLPHLTGFCNIKEGTEQMGVLFNSKMVSFPNLTSLEVLECKSLKHIFSVSMVKCLMQLKKLKISDCELVEEIIQRKKLEEIEEEEEEGDSREAIVFPKLDYLSLEKCKNVKWFSSCCSIEFPLLRELHIKDCSAIVNFVGRDSSSESSEEYLFNEMVTFSNLETMHIEGIHSIKYLWDEQHIADDSFSKLKSIYIESCSNLAVVFPSEICTRFQGVETLILSNCHRVEEIYQSIDLEKVNEPFSLRGLWISHLLSLKHIWNKESEWNKGSFSTFQNLQSVAVTHCGDLKWVFPNISLAKFTSNLEELTMDRQGFRAIHDYAEFCSKLRKVTLCSLDENTSVAVSHNFLGALKSLETLVFFACSLNDLLNQRPIGDEQHHYLRVKHLRLGFIQELNYITVKDSQFSQHLQTLHLELCYDLVGITASSTCLQNLTTLHVDNCGKMKNLVTASTAKTMVHLVEMKVVKCERIEEIVGKDGDDTEHDVMIIFNKLQRLELRGLPSLNSFCSDKYTLSFPLLGIVTIEQCPRMKSFGCGGAVCTPKLRGILFEGEQQWEGNLDATISSQLRTWFDDHLGDVSCFQNLQKVELVNSTISSKAALLPNQMHFLNKLREITLRDCNSTQLVFDLEGLSAAEGYIGLLPKLQQLNLVNLPLVTQLCSKSPIGILDFNKLQVLQIDNCSRLEYAFTWSMASFLPQLERVEMKNCEMMKTLIVDEEDVADKVTFNKLENVVLQNMPKFSSIYLGNNDLEFPSLKQVSIRECPSIKALLIGMQVHSNNQVGDHLGDIRYFQNLESLEVVNSKISSKAALLPNQMHFLNKLSRITLRDCNSTQLVFDLEGLSAAEGYIGLLPKLLELNLVNLPLVTQLCNKAPIGILDFNKLKVLQIDNCSRLEYVFTWSMASVLPQLGRVEMKNCEMMKTLIVDEEDVADKVTFNKLKDVVLEKMPKFSSIYLGNNDLEFPSLNSVTIAECPSIKALLIGTQVHSNNQVFPKLEELSISVDMKSVRGMMQFEAPSHLFSNLKTLELSHFSATTTSHALLVRFLSRFPNLDRLKLCDSSFQVLPNCNTEGTPTLPLKKSSTLTNLHKLCKIWWPASLFQSLETLEVAWCPSLVNLASSSASFQNLVTLTITGCDQMMNLMTPSVAKSMVQLKLLTVTLCKMLMEIVGDGSDQATDEIVFPKLETLELINLQSLKAFSLTHHHFSFPCLDRVALYRCPSLRIFCNGIVNTTILNCVLDGELHGSRFWEGNLNTTTEHLYHQMVGFRYAEEIKLSASPVLIEKWEAEFPTGFLYYLRRLVVDNCKLFSNAVPPRLLRHLKRLEVLVVEKCDYVEQVIDLEGLNANEFGNNGMEFLKELHLMDLPRLRQVWTKDPQHILIFKNLQTLKVDKCGSLTFIFDLSMALSLKNLQHIEVKHCSLVEHIIMISEEETVLQYQTILPSLKCMALLHLANLVGFFSTSGVLEFPSLKTIEVADCPNLELFAATFPEGQHSSITVEERGESVGIEDPDSISALLGNKIVMPELEELKVEWTPLKDQLFGNYRSGFLSKLKRIELTNFQGKEDANFLSNFLRHFHSLENLCLTDFLVEEMTLDDLNDLKDDNSEPVLTRLKISNFRMLKHLVHDDCQPIPLFENLVDLEVIGCSSLKILVPCSVSFHNLTDLQVSKCDGLTTLLSASTARSLVQLRRMDVKDCKMMQEIVDIASDGEEYEIRFSQLEYLGFDDLPGLKNFSSGNYDFHFPSLEEVMVIGCPSMKNFAEKVSVTTKLRKVKTGRLYQTEEGEGEGEGEWEWEWEGSLNNTIQALYMQKDVEETVAIRSES